MATRRKNKKIARVLKPKLVSGFRSQEPTARGSRALARWVRSQPTARHAVKTRGNPFPFGKEIKGAIKIIRRGGRKIVQFRRSK